MSEYTATAHITCAWFLLCDRPATGTSPHPILGDVAICERCATKYDLPLVPFASEVAS